MKNLKCILLLVSGCLSFNMAAQDRKVIYVESAKVTAPLMQKWISEYSKENPLVEIRIADKKIKKEDVTLNVCLNEAYDSISPDKDLLCVARYAILPVTCKCNSILTTLGNDRLNKKKLIDLFFNNEDEDDNKKQDKHCTTVYSGNNNTASAAVAFANYFGYKPSDIKGKKISGDDIYLLKAIDKDSTGITFNNLSYIYDIDSRQLKKELSLLPLDLKKEFREILNSATIDDLLTLLENQTIDLIPVQNIEIMYSVNDCKETAEFAKWILIKGISYNHNYGFLRPDENTLNLQQQHIQRNYLTSTNKN